MAAATTSHTTPSTIPIPNICTPVSHPPIVSQLLWRSSDCPAVAPCLSASSDFPGQSSCHCEFSVFLFREANNQCHTSYATYAIAAVWLCVLIALSVSIVSVLKCAWISHHVLSWDVITFSLIANILSQLSMISFSISLLVLPGNRILPVNSS